ncbi:porin [Undibacterium parvum]|uniref:Porin n=1 Tax=Undibacterium parvum TaxID=401471 RepID=A0A3Q9BRZ5_9BURK|nr:porin [Undibacterium parvum]AZP13158.1 porin [Undibacterium parvum]
MKKSLLALALMGAFSGAALAQSSVTVYGVVDMGVVRDDNGTATKYSLDSGVQSGSRLGFKGTEDLGNGLKANFVLEMGVGVDTGASEKGTDFDKAQGKYVSNSSATFGRQAFVGLSGDFGAVNFGRQKSLTYVASESIDPFGAGLAGDMSRLFSTTNRFSNAAVYSTPKMSGFSASALYVFGEEAGNNSAKSVGSLSGTYSDGPVFASIVYEKAKDGQDPAATIANTGEKTLIGGTYDFGMAKAHAAYELLKGGNGTTVALTKKNVWMIGATVPVGAGSIIADYSRITDTVKSNANATQFALGYTYSLSKRTNLYTSYSQTKNDTAANYNVLANIKDPVTGKVTTSYSGNSDKLFNVGIRHAF